MFDRFSNRLLGLTFPGRLQLWLSSLMEESLSAQTVVPQLAATLYGSFTNSTLFLTSIFKANRVTDKLTHVHDRIYCCRSGSAADTQAVADIVHYYLQMYRYEPLIHSLQLCFKPCL
jgi:hypothetical protein